MKKLIEKLKGAKDYILDRLDERSTWGDIIMGIGGAALLPYPWNLASMLAAIVKALLPDGKVHK